MQMCVTTCLSVTPSTNMTLSVGGDVLAGVIFGLFYLTSIPYSAADFI